jgi:hypothetical protein
MPPACASAGDRHAGSRAARLPAGSPPPRGRGARDRSPSPPSSAAPNSSRGQWVIRRQSPAGEIIGDFEAVGDPEMAAENPCAIPALEANHIILLY